MTSVMCFGTFDVLHPGHLYYLKESKKQGDKLIVVIARDANIKKIKGESPKYNEVERLSHVKELKFVDKAILGNIDDMTQVIFDNLPDILCLGYDQDSMSVEEIKENLKKRGLTEINIMRMRPFNENVYKSSKLK